MRRLKLPNRKDPVRAEDIRDMVLAIIENNVTAGLGLRETQTPNGKILSVIPVHQKAAAVSGSYPRCFDIKSIAAGKIKLTNCCYQIGAQWVTTSQEPEATIATGVLCAVFNSKTGIFTASVDATWSAATPNLIPIALYHITASTDGQTATVTLDRRGSHIVIHE